MNCWEERYCGQCILREVESIVYGKGTYMYRLSLVELTLKKKRFIRGESSSHRQRIQVFIDVVRTYGTFEESPIRIVRTSNSSATINTRDVPESTYYLWPEGVRLIIKIGLSYRKEFVY